MLFFTEIRRVIKEGRNTVTIQFSNEIKSIPGQFVMVYVPGYEEIPLSLSSESSVMVRPAGITTKRLAEMKKGDVIGIRGPYGNGFEISGNRFLLIAGGIGIAPLRYLWEDVSGDLVLAYGERTGGNIINLDSFEGETFIFTENGSAGIKGVVTDVFDLINPSEFDQIFVCGPELMMPRIVEVLENQNILNKAQFSVERYIKCGIGLCGSCGMDPHGLRVCKEGPVLKGEMLKNSELGRYYRDASGWRNVWKD